MVTSSIKFWKAMEKFDVSRSLFLSKKFESSKFESSKAVVHEKSFKIQHSTLIVQLPNSCFSLPIF